MTPLVSIITPSYNQAAFLEYTIHSVLAQAVLCRPAVPCRVEHPLKIEYIIIDGGSTDGSLEIIQRYASRLSYWISEPDSGQAEAINKGFLQARGEFIAWINSDDVYLPGAVARAVAALQQNPQAAFVFGNAITIDAQGRPINLLNFAQPSPRTLRHLMEFRILCQPAVFMRRSFLNEISLDPSYHFMLDHHLWLRLARQAPIQYIEGAPLAAARHHPGAKNIAQAARFSQEILRLHDWLQTQPEYSQHPDRPSAAHIRGGAYRLSGRYLLDGDLYVPALQSYWKALLAWPSYALRHWRRILYAGLCLLGARRWLDALRPTPGANSALNTRLKAQFLRQYSAASDGDTLQNIGLNLDC